MSGGIAVLGAGGWLGSSIWGELSGDDGARSLGRAELAQRNADELRELLRPDPHLTVVNAVGRLRGAEGELADANLRFVARLVEALRGTGAHLVHLGSAAEYGDQGQTLITERATAAPATAYGRLKAEASALVLTEPSWCVLRPFNVIDRSMVPENPVGIIRAQVLAGGSVDLPAATARRDHVSRSFVAASVARAARDRVAGAFNLCSGIGVTYTEIAAAIARASGADITVTDLDRPGIRTVVGDPTAWQTATGLREALDADDVAGLVLADR